MKSIIEQASSIVKAIEKAWNQAEQPKEFSIKIFEKEERNFFGMTTKPAKIGIFFGDKPIIHEKPVQKPRPEIKECRPVAAPTSPKGYEGHSKATKDKPAAAPTKPAINHAPKQIKPEQQQTTRPAPQAKPVSSFAPTSYSAKATKDTSPKQGFQLRQGYDGHDEGHSKASVSAPTSPKGYEGHSKAMTDTSADKQQDVAGKKQATTFPQQKSHESAPTEKPKRAPAVWNDAMIASAHAWLNKTLSLMDRGSVSFNSEVAGKNLKLTFNMPLIADVTHEKQLFRSFAHLIMSSLRNQYKQEIRDLKVILIRPE
jgi:hypothetical protein